MSGGNSAPNVTDVTGCPVAPQCSTCGAAGRNLEVAIVETPVGVRCVTLCTSCVESQAVPRFPSWSAAIEQVGTHCEHLGCDVDEMEAALAWGR